MKRILPLLMVLCLLLSGCALPGQPAEKQYTATFLDLFDTVTTVIGFAESEEAFKEKVQPIHDALLKYHQFFDIYEDYEGIANLKTVNDRAGTAPVAVDRAIIDLLTDCKTYYTLTGGRVNAAMGSVLRLWHDARNDGINDPVNARLPETDALALAAEHMDFDRIIIDSEKATVFITDADQCGRQCLRHRSQGFQRHPLGHRYPESRRRRVSSYHLCVRRCRGHQR